ncbi:MAG TPA: general stress protein, partial [Kofleriaceae bacterium]
MTTIETTKHDKKIVVFGLFDHRSQLEAAIDVLRSEGFREQDMSALLPDMDATKDLAHEKHTKAPEGAMAGAATGGVLGGTLGLLLGIGALAIPGLGPFIAAGPIMATLAGAGIGGAVGTLTGALVGMGIPEYEAKRYESFLNKGGSLLSVHADNDEWAKRAKSAL